MEPRAANINETGHDVFLPSFGCVSLLARILPHPSSLLSQRSLQEFVVEKMADAIFSGSTF
jgi:hypothetical protein